MWEEYELTRREAEEVGERIEDLPTAQRRLAELKNKIKALGAVNVGAWWSTKRCQSGMRS